jgi:hypothetical protein
MNRSGMLIALTGVLGGVIGLVTQGLAGTSPSQSTLRRRAMVSCMTKQMTASKTISYNEATKLCKEQQKAQNASLVANNPQRRTSER